MSDLEGKFDKAGVNETFQIKERPADPAPIRKLHDMTPCSVCGNPRCFPDWHVRPMDTQTRDVVPLMFDGLCATCEEKMPEIRVGALVTYHDTDAGRVARADCDRCSSSKRQAKRKGIDSVDLVLLVDAMDVIKSVRQQVHQAHHHGEVEHCTMNTCTSATDILRRARVTA